MPKVICSIEELKEHFMPWPKMGCITDTIDIIKEIKKDNTIIFKDFDEWQGTIDDINFLISPKTGEVLIDNGKTRWSVLPILKK